MAQLLKAEPDNERYINKLKGSSATWRGSTRTRPIGEPALRCASRSGRGSRRQSSPLSGLGTVRDRGRPYCAETEPPARVSPASVESMCLFCSKIHIKRHHYRYSHFFFLAFFLGFFIDKESRRWLFPEPLSRSPSDCSCRAHNGTGGPGAAARRSCHFSSPSSHSSGSWSINWRITWCRPLRASIRTPVFPSPLMPAALGANSKRHGAASTYRAESHQALDAEAQTLRVDSMTAKLRSVKVRVLSAPARVMRISVGSHVGDIFHLGRTSVTTRLRRGGRRPSDRKNHWKISPRLSRYCLAAHGALCILSVVRYRSQGRLLVNAIGDRESTLRGFSRRRRILHTSRRPGQ